MARLWQAYRDGLRLLGVPAGDVSADLALSKLDIAPWRFFASAPPETTSREELLSVRTRQRVLLELRASDLDELSGYAPGLYESPFSIDVVLRRMGLTANPGAGSQPPGPKV